MVWGVLTLTNDFIPGYIKMISRIDLTDGLDKTNHRGEVGATKLLINNVSLIG